MDLVFLSLQGLRISRYPGEDAFLSSHKVGDCTQHRFSSCKGFLLPPHPQVGTPVSRKRFALSSATPLTLRRYKKVANSLVVILVYYKRRLVWYFHEHSSAQSQRYQAS